ncbi:MAG: hypothetical protein KDE51_27915 [Anaerolineales bacterium]|nr:hypothetical protein [Anaerolineales bacterium]
MLNKSPRIIIRLLIVFAFVVPTFIIPKPSYACSCVMPGTPVEEFDRVPVVFEGTVTRAGSLTRSAWLWPILSYLPFEYTERFYNRQIQFTVTRAWKGVEYDQITVQTGYGGGDCGYGFTTGRTYLVYASKVQKGGLYTGICSRTAEIGRAADDLAYLETRPVLPLPPDRRRVWGWLGLSLVIVAAGAGGRAWIRQRAERSRMSKND